MTTRKTIFDSRVADVRRLLPAWNVSALLVGGTENRRWLSGFTGSAGSLLITADEAWLATDSRYWTQAEIEAPAFALYRLDTNNQLSDLLREQPDPIGLEAQHLTVATYQDLQQKTGQIELRPLAQTVEPLRSVKSEEEQRLIRDAAAITDIVMAAVPTLVQVGQTERELAWLLEKSLRENGADTLAFPIIVASGPNAALPHHRPGDRALQPGDTLIVDMGAALSGYHSDLTRTFHLGTEPTDTFWEIYTLTLAAHAATLADMQAGMTGKEIDTLARDRIAAGGHGDHFGHGLGHGVGLAIHEDPRLSPRSGGENRVPAGAVVTVEPGIYIPGWGGVRLEDLVVVGEGGIELLSHCPKEPLIAL